MKLVKAQSGELAVDFKSRMAHLDAKTCLVDQSLPEQTLVAPSKILSRIRGQRHSGVTMAREDEPGLAAEHHHV